jgi:hypothetical protein
MELLRYVRDGLSPQLSPILACLNIIDRCLSHSSIFLLMLKAIVTYLSNKDRDNAKFA